MSTEVEEVSKAIGNLGTLTNTIKDKISLFGSNLDTRANHEQVTELTKEGRDLVQTITGKLQELVNSASGANKSAARKLNKDFKAQVTLFENICKKFVSSESEAVESIRSTSVRMDPLNDKDLRNYNEDKIYAQANVQVYDEDDLARREEDIVQITHKLGEIKAAYQEIDGLIEDQKEIVVEINENTEKAAQDTAGALSNVQEADKKTGYATCTCCYLCTVM